jgi:hypothetical protein
MSDRGAGIPLAFVLALSASAGASAPPTQDRAELLAPGSLRVLLPDDPAGVADQMQESGSNSSIRQLVQWFNVGPAICYNGVWRRC